MTADVDLTPDVAARSERAWRPAAVIGFSWAVVASCVMLAFFPTWRRVAQEASAGAITGYLFVLPFLAAVAAQGVARRRAGELPIHDRQTDIIVGGLVLVASAAIKALWLPRFADSYELFHLDVLAAGVFLLGASILIFGLRPVGRFWSVWLLLVGLSPLLYRVVAISLGGSRFAYSAVLVILAGVAGAIAVGRTRTRGWLGFACTIATGFALLAAMLMWWPDAHIATLQLLPTVGAAVLTGTVFYIVARRGVHTSAATAARRVGPVTAKRSVSSLIIVLACAAALAFLPLPPPKTITQMQGPTGTGIDVPQQWSRIGETQHYDWAKSYFGRTATLNRMTMRADARNPDWDIDSRPRTVVVDTLSTVNTASLAVYPEDTLYRLSNARASTPLPVTLGRGIVGNVSTSVSDALLLTWTKLTFTWTRGALTQRITIIAVDNHEPDALFPEPTPSVASNITATMATFLRGNSIAVDDDPDYKDLNMLTSFGRSFVASQWDRR